MYEAKIIGTGVTFFVIYRKPTEMSVNIQIKLLSNESTLYPTTHLPAHVVHVKGKLISIPDLKIVYSSQIKRSERFYQWVYEDLLGETLLPSTGYEHMDSLFFNTKMYNMVSSNGVFLVLFVNLPVVNIQDREHIASFAAHHIIQKKQITESGIHIMSDILGRKVIIDMDNNTVNGIHIRTMGEDYLIDLD